MKKLALLAALGISTIAAAATTDIATVPVMNITGTGSIKPNVMLMLDDSGSMGWDYTPDYVNDSNKCLKNTDTSVPAGTCAIGHVPYMSPDFNSQYYNPDVTYAPGVDSTGASLGSQTTFTAVKTDPYGVQQENQSGSSTTTENLTANYPDLVWCSVSSPTAANKADPNVCKYNAAYVYPDPSGGTFRYSASVSGAPYYYRLVTTKYCSDANLTNCIAAGAPAGSYTYPAPVRWCTTAVTDYAYTDCQKNYGGSYTRPEFLGTVQPATGSTAAYGTIQVVTAGSQYSLNSVMVEGVSIISGSVTGATASAAATNLASAINSYSSTPEYRACVGTRSADNTCTGSPNSLVTLFPQTATGGSTAQTGTAANGRAITVAGPTSTAAAATGTLTVNAGPAGSATYWLNAVLAGAATISTSSISFTGDLSTAAGRQAAAAAIAIKIGAGYSATSSNGVVTITASTAGTAGNQALSTTSGAIQATGTITVSAGAAGSKTYQISSISAGATTISTSAISATADLSTAAGRQTAAAAIAAKIGNGHTATSANGVVTVTATTGGTAGNKTLTYVAPASAQAAGSITINAGPAGSGTYKITTIKAGTATIASNLTHTGDLSTAAGRQAAATAIAAAIGNGYSATAAGGVVTVTSNTAGSAGNVTLSVTVPSVVKPTGTVTVNTATNTTVSKLAIAAGGACTTSISAGNGILSGSTNSSSTESTVASRIDNNVSYSGYSASRSGSVVTVSAPNSTLNGCALTPTYNNGSITGGTFSGGSDPMPYNASGLSGGTDGPITVTLAGLSGGLDSIPVTTSGMSGGTDAQSTTVVALTSFANGTSGSATPTRINVGTFQRTNIVACAGGAAATCYPKASTRTDCAAAGGCTYAEEMTNFANWYAYYRTRMQTMKSAAGLAFSPLGASYRVGFANLSNVGYGGAVDMTPADFNSANKAIWYTNLYAANPGVSTPLRTALDAIGKMYANQAPYNYAGAAKVVQYPCQQNFVILTTDGLWNQSYSGSVSNNDNTESTTRFCTKANGCFDGITASPTNPSLADVALYWYNGGSNNSTVSLRPDLEADMSTPGVVPSGTTDPNTHLHMSTFTLGLGVSGYMNYEKNYDTAPTVSGDYYKLITSSSGCSWNGGGTYVWPNPVENTLTAVDDLWHAAVNGHGKYFSARNPNDVVTGLSAAIAAMAVRAGAASAAATSTPNVSQQDNDIFSATFTTVLWTGELFDQKIDPTTGDVSSTVTWTSNNTLGLQVGASADTRNIYMLDASGGAPVLKSFLYPSMTATEKAWFDNKASLMVQYGLLSAANQTIANSGTNLVNWLRGQTQHANGDIYRAYSMTSTPPPGLASNIPIVLGDIATAKPAYLRNPRKSYGGSYSAFALGNASRAATVFAAANDGMLHAFNATNGTELWAYAPRITMAKLYKQAAIDYGSNHQFTVDGSPELADVQIGGAWRTVLVGGLNGGGRGYYALDVTDPLNPLALWEFCTDSTLCSKTDPDMGLTFGNPQFGKWNNQWVVIVASGYNNVPGTDGIASGSGGGYLYVLDISDGSILKKIATGIGSVATPSGLAKITAITNNPQTDPKITYVYGGDNEGNLWRFDFTDPTFAAIPVVKMATLGSAQPITSRPEVSQCSVGGALQKVVLLGTGRLLGVSDTTSTDLQSVYLVKDTGTALGALNGAASMVRQTMSTLAGSGGSSYTLATPQPVDLSAKNGWYTDLSLNAGERVNLDPKVVFGTAIVVSNIPTSASACTIGGTSNNYQFGLCTGSYTDSTSQILGGVLSNTSAAVGFIVVKLPSGTIKMITTTASGAKVITSIKASASSASRKTGWRSVRN